MTSIRHGSGVFSGFAGALRRGSCGLVAFAALTLATAQEPIHTAQAVRQLGKEQADAHRAVQLRGVVTFFDEVLYSRFIQDETAGIYLRESTNTPGLQPGQLVEVSGTTSSGEYAPIIMPEQVRVIGEAPLPAARPVTYEELASGREDSQFVEISGIVRSAHLEEASQYHLLELATGGGRLSVYARKIPVAQPEELVDSVVRVRGVCSTLFNRQRQLFAIRLMAPRPEDLRIETPAAADPFGIAPRAIGSLLQFTPRETYGHRVKVAGTVIYQEPGKVLFLQDGQEGLQVRTRQIDPL